MPKEPLSIKLVGEDLVLAVTLHEARPPRHL